MAEDDAFFSKVFKAKLLKEGYDVIVAPNGEELLKEARKRKPDLIILDLIMPIMDGFAALTELKKDPVLKDIKVIISSTLEQKEDIDKTKSLGAAGYINKSDITNVFEKIKKYI